MARKKVRSYSEGFRKNAVRLADYNQLILTIMSKKLFIVIFVLGSIIPICRAQPLSDELEKNIKSRIEGGVNVGIAIGIVDSVGSHFYNYGIRSLESQEPIDENTVFEIASITKTFTGIIMANMILTDEIKPDDDLQDYLPPGIKAPMRNGKSIKLVELANHTSSLPHSPDNLNPSNPENPYADYTEDQLYDFINSFKPTGLKFHTYVKLGIVGYDDSVDKYLKPSEEDKTRLGGNAPNKIDKVDLQ